MKTLRVGATEFKAKCLDLLEEVEKRGTPVTITRRGLPVAVLHPAKRENWKSPRNSWSSQARIVGDIVNADAPSLWEITRRK